MLNTNSASKMTNTKMMKTVGTMKILLSSCSKPLNSSMKSKTNRLGKITKRTSKKLLETERAQLNRKNGTRRTSKSTLKTSERPSWTGRTSSCSRCTRVSWKSYRRTRMFTCLHLSTSNLTTSLAILALLDLMPAREIFQKREHIFRRMTYSGIRL